MFIVITRYSLGGEVLFDDENDKDDNLLIKRGLVEILRCYHKALYRPGYRGRIMQLSGLNFSG